jgi:hypothetical protein
MATEGQARGYSKKGAHTEIPRGDLSVGPRFFKHKKYLRARACSCALVRAQKQFHAVTKQILHMHAVGHRIANYLTEPNWPGHE